MSKQTVMTPDHHAPSARSVGRLRTLRRIDHVEFYVGNARQAAYFFTQGLGFRPMAYLGPETGSRDRVSYVLAQGKIRFVLSSGLAPEHPITQHVATHGDGARDVAILVDDARVAFAQAIERGATPVAEPTPVTDDHGTFIRAAIGTYGDMIHSLIERRQYHGRWAPGYVPVDAPLRGVGLLEVDHVVGNVPAGEMDRWSDYYGRVFDFRETAFFDRRDIGTQYSALTSRVMASQDGRIKFPLNEPAEGRRKSQVEEFLEAYRGPGVQHLALATANIVRAVALMRAHGVRFLAAPQAYYDELPNRVGEIEEQVDEIQRLAILVDRDAEGYLLQIFTEPIVDRPTLFFEIIQRHGSRGFGKGNFKALFEAIETEQERRGNL